mgnify:CR=1 FL=1
MPGSSPQLDNPSWNIPKNRMDRESSVSCKTEDNAELDIVASFEAQAVCREAAEAGPELAAERDTEADFWSSTEVVHGFLKNIIL